jgi:hypothetical protein
MKGSLGIAVVPRRSKPGPCKMKITQEDLAEEVALHQEAKDAVGSWQHKRKFIREMLEAGASVDPGLHGVALRRTKVMTVR